MMHEAVPSAANGFALCTFAGRTLAVPQTDILRVVHRQSLLPPLQNERVAGWFETSLGRWPVYSLDAELKIAPPSTGSFAVFVRDDRHAIAVLCESVHIAAARTLNMQLLPIVMSSEAHPIRGFARINDKLVVWIVSEGMLASYLTRLAGQALQ
jgi:hypothetical protein